MAKTDLTLTEMMKTIKPGEIAYSLEMDVHITLADTGYFVGCDDKGSYGTYKHGNRIPLEPALSEVKWDILPQFVTFAQAMAAVEEGKTVECHYGKEPLTITSYNGKIGNICEGSVCSSGGGATLKLCYMYSDNWIIKEEQ